MYLPRQSLAERHICYFWDLAQFLQGSMHTGWHAMEFWKEEATWRWETWVLVWVLLHPVGSIGATCCLLWILNSILWLQEGISMVFWSAKDSDERDMCNLAVSSSVFSTESTLKHLFFQDPVTNARTFSELLLCSTTRASSQDRGVKWLTMWLLCLKPSIIKSHNGKDVHWTHSATIYWPSATGTHWGTKLSLYSHMKLEVWWWRDSQGIRHVSDTTTGRCSPRKPN